MKIIKGLFKTEIELQPGELTDFWQRERTPVFWGIIRWLDKYLDFKLVNDKKSK